MCNNIVFKSFYTNVNPWRLLVLAETCRARKLVYLVLINGILVVKYEYVGEYLIFKSILITVLLYMHL
jgi:hypothetical protein